MLFECDKMGLSTFFYRQKARYFPEIFLWIRVKQYSIISAFNGARRQKCDKKIYKLDEYPLVVKWWWNDPPCRICWVRLWNMLIVFFLLLSIFLPFLLWLFLLFCFVSSFIFIYFLFLIGYRSSFFWHSASAARGSAIHVFLVFGYLCIQEILVVTKSYPSVRTSAPSV